MPLSSTEQQIAKIVVDRFMNLKECTSRKDLVTKFKSYKAVDRLISIGLLSKLDNDGSLVPLSLGIECVGDTECLKRAKSSVEITLQTLQNLYEINPPRKQVTVNEVVTHAAKLYGSVTREVIELGLHFIEEFPILESYGSQSNQPSRERVHVMDWMVISERIVAVDVRNAWDEHVRGRKATLEAITGPAGGTQRAGAENQDILVFISHSSKDDELALALVELLKAGLGLLAHQIRCSSVDGYRLPAGVNTESKLRDEVKASRVVIGLITPSSLSSAFVMFELGARWGAERFLVPLLAGVRPSELSGPLALLNALSSSNESQLHQLLGDISEQLGLPLQNAASYVRYISRVKVLSEGVPKSAAVPQVTPEAPRPNVGCLRPELTSVAYDEESDVWSRGSRESVPAAVVPFSNEARRGVRTLAVNGLRARLTYFKQDSVEEVKRVDSGCWLGEAYRSVDLEVGGVVYLIAALRTNNGAGVIANPRHLAVRYSEDPTVLDYLPFGDYELEVDLFAGAHGEYAEKYWFRLEVGEQLKIQRLNQRPGEAS